MLTDPAFWAQLLEIIFINFLLSGDNAMVIALAARTLPDNLRNWAIIGGTGSAAVLLILFTMIITYLLQVPFLKLIGGILLLWVAIKLLIPEAESDDGDEKTPTTLFGAIGTILLANIIMSLDNVIGVAAVAKGNVILLIMGLVISIPLVALGSSLMIKLLGRFPILVTLGGGLLGWIGGDVAVTDASVEEWISDLPPQIPYIVAGTCAVFVVAVGLTLRRIQARRHTAQVAD